MAADMALASPLLEDINIEGASGVLVNVAHGENYSLLEHSDAMDHIYEKVGEEGNPNIIIGDITDPALGDKVCITIIATGCGGTANAQVKAPAFNAAAFANPVKQNIMTQSIPSIPSQAASAAAAAPAVQPATPRPTGFNVFDFNKIKDDSEVEMFTRPVAKPAAQPQPVQETASIPSLTETPVVRSVNAAMFNSPEFNAAAPAEEDVIPQGSETSEFSAVADEDRLNGGRGGVEKTMAFAGMEAPAYVRQTMVAESTRVASRTETVAEAAQDFVDYSLPAYLRNRDNNNNF
jgi:cell division protein FtsZ